MAVKKVYSNKSKPGWLYRAGGWPKDPKRRAFMSWGFDLHWRDANGKEYRKKEPGFISEAEARIAADKFKQAKLRTRYGIVELPTAPTLEQLVKKHLPQIASRRERVRATRITKILLDACGKTLPVDQLHSSHLLTFIDLRKRLTPDVGPSTIDRDLNIISTMLHAGAVYFPALAQWRTPKLPRPRVSKRRRERTINAQEEITKLCDYLYRPRESEPPASVGGPVVYTESEIQYIKRRNVAHVFRMTLLTASRKGEICRLRWDQIDWHRGQFQLIGTKTQFSQATTSRYPKITNSIAEIFRERWAVQMGEEVSWKRKSHSKSFSVQNASEDTLTTLVPTPLKPSGATTKLPPPTDGRISNCAESSGPYFRNRMARKAESPYVFTSQGGEVTDYYRIIAEAARACGLLYGRKTLGGFVTHDTRHTAVSYLVHDLGYDLPTVAEITGHSNATIVLLYSHIKRATVLAAYDDLEKQFAGTGTLGRE